MVYKKPCLQGTLMVNKIKIWKAIQIGRSRIDGLYSDEKEEENYGRYESCVMAEYIGQLGFQN